MEHICRYHNIIWLGLFATTFFVSEELIFQLEFILLILLTVFVVDLIILYRKSKNLKDFFKTYWLDILMVIPYLRVIRIFRLLRVLKVMRASRVVKILKVFKASIKQYIRRLRKKKK